MKENLGNKNINNLSKNDIINKISNIKQTKNNLNRNIIIKRNKDRINLFSPKRNLTCLTFFNNCSNIFENKYEYSNKKLKKELILDSDYSSIINRNSKLHNSGSLLTGLNSQNFINTEIKYRKLFSANASRFNFSENRTKSSTTKYTKSNIFNTDSSFKKNEIFLLSPNISNDNIHYNKKAYNYLLKTSFSKFRRENISIFKEKTRNIRKEKIIKLELEKAYQSKSEINKEKLYLLNNNKKEYYKKLELLNKFSLSFNNYIRNLKYKKIKEKQIYDELIKQKINLDLDNQKINYQINKLQIDKEKYTNIEDLFLLIKYGTEYLNNKNKKKDFTLNFKNKSDNKKEKKVVLSSTVEQNGILKSNKENIQKNKYKKYYSINSAKKNYDTNLKEKKLNKSIKKTKTMKNKDERRDSSIFTNIYEINHLLTNLENILLNDLNHLNEQKAQVNILKKNLYHVDINNDYKINKLKNSKSEMLDFLKKENDKLLIRLKLMKKNESKMENFRYILEKKLLKILININKEIDFQDKLKVKDIFYLLKMESSEFFNKIHISKTLYMIKIIEFITLYLNDLMNSYLKDKKTEELFKNFCFKFEKEKILKKRKIIKEQVKQNIEEKKKYILEKVNKIRFFSYKKYDFKNKKYHTSKEKIVKKNNSNDKIEEWI